ncbi:MAG: hypothetical protein HUK20_07970, partial [Fibrobacter sp.]|nr:hypothetical protein [Fibrobacter sp.]
LVIKEFKVNPDEETFVDLKCRESGILNFILNLCRLDNTVSMTCSSDSIEYKASSLKGTIQRSVPLGAVTAVCTAIHKEVKLIFTAGAFLLTFVALLIIGIFQESGGGFIAMGIVCLVLAIACVVAFILDKTIMLAVQNGGDNYAACIVCKPAVIAGERIDSAKFEQVVQLLREKVNDVHRK